jgi:hypothetical protein
MLGIIEKKSDRVIFVVCNTLQEDAGLEARFTDTSLLPASDAGQ